MPYTGEECLVDGHWVALRDNHPPIYLLCGELFPASAQGDPSDWIMVTSVLDQGG